MKWGILATGRIAHRFASTVLAMAAEGEELVAVASRDMARGEAFAAEFNNPKVYDSYEGLAKDPEVEAIYIATPNQLHYENTKLCLENGKHVLCEKPFTLKGAEAEELYALAKEKGLFLMEAFWIALLPAQLQMQAWIKEGRIGEIVKARVDYGFKIGPERRYRKFAPELGGGALLDIGVYNLGFLHMVIGENPEKYTTYVHKNEFGTDEFSVIDLEYPGGITATATTSIGTQIDRRAMIVGTKGMICFNDFQGAESVMVTTYDGQEETKEFPFEINGFEYQIREVRRNATNPAGVVSHSDIYTPKASVDTLALMEEILETWN